MPLDNYFTLFISSIIWARCLGKEHEFVIVIQKSEIRKKHVILNCEGKINKYYKNKLVRKFISMILLCIVSEDKFNISEWW